MDLRGSWYDSRRPGLDILLSKGTFVNWLPLLDLSLSIFLFPRGLQTHVAEAELSHIHFSHWRERGKVPMPIEALPCCDEWTEFAVCGIAMSTVGFEKGNLSIGQGEVPIGTVR